MPVEPTPYLTQLGMRAIGARAGVEPLTIPWLSAWPGDAPAIPPHRPPPRERAPRRDDDPGSPLVEAGGDSVSQAQPVAPAVAPTSDAGSLRPQRVSAGPAPHAAAGSMGGAPAGRVVRGLPSDVPTVAGQAASPDPSAIGSQRARGRIDVPAERARETPTSPATGAPEPPRAGSDGAPRRGRLVSQASPPGARDIPPAVPSALRSVAPADGRRGQPVRPAAVDAASTTHVDAPRATPTGAPGVPAPGSFLAGAAQSEPSHSATTPRSPSAHRPSLAPRPRLERSPSWLDAAGNRETAEQDRGPAPANRPAGPALRRELRPPGLPAPVAPARARQAALPAPVAIAKPLEREVGNARRLAAAAPPVVRVRIGRIEINTARPAPQTPPRRASAPVESARPRAPAMSLADYLKRREGTAQ